LEFICSLKQHQSQKISFYFGLVSNREREKLNIFELGEIFSKVSNEPGDLRLFVLTKNSENQIKKTNKNLNKFLLMKQIFL
jgi:hypothetical protein